MTARTSRRAPRWSELRELIGTGSPSSRVRRPQSTTAASIEELRLLARRRTPKAVFDYVDGGAEGEISLRRSREAFDQVEFRPRVLRDVSQVDTSTVVLGDQASMPLVSAPTGFTRMMHHEGETAVARAAAAAGLPYTLSTMGTTSIEDLVSVTPQGPRWMQLYLWRDRGRSKDLIERARESGYSTLILTVDVPVAGARLRDLRNGLTIPPALTARTVADMARHPRWWFNLLTTQPLQFASLGDGAESLADIVNGMFDPCVTMEDLTWVRSCWPGSLAVKGIQSIADARLCVEHGADAIIVSNHGGRQLDRAPVPLELLAPMVDAVGAQVDVLLDGGVRTGADIAAAAALGAKACLVGRAYLYGLMAGGESGVERAFEILHAELTRTMQLLGVHSIAELTREHVRLRL